MAKTEMPITHPDADEFKDWWDRDARRLAGVDERVGRIETR
jgi:hypothetical protein